MIIKKENLMQNTWQQCLDRQALSLVGTKTIDFYPLAVLSSSIAEWHAITFPNATLEGQLSKVLEEYREFLDTTSDSEEELNELVDIYIVCAALKYRFGYDFAIALMGLIENKCLKRMDLYNGIMQKMDKNSNRIWEEIEPGVYHHKSAE